MGKDTEGYFTATQQRLKKFVASGQLGIFANGYWGHPDYKLTPEQNLIATVHYLDALEWQKEVVKDTRRVRGQESASKLYRRRYALQHRLK